MNQAEWREMVDQDEHYLVHAIRTHLLTEGQRRFLFEKNISIEDILNGRVEGGNPPEVEQMFADWNMKLGWKEFGT